MGKCCKKFLEQSNSDKYCGTVDNCVNRLTQLSLTCSIVNLCGNNGNSCILLYEQYNDVKLSGSWGKMINCGNDI